MNCKCFNQNSIEQCCECSINNTEYPHMQRDFKMSAAYFTRKEYLETRQSPSLNLTNLREKGL